MRPPRPPRYRSTPALALPALLGCLAAAGCVAEPPAASPPQQAPPGASLERWYPELAGRAAPATRAELEALVLAGLADAPHAADLRARMHAAVQAADWEGLRRLLARASASEELLRARQLFAAGDARAAEELVARLVRDVEPDAATRALRADIWLALAADRPAEFARAKREFLESAALDPTRRAWSGASRAARALGEHDKALEYARRALSLPPDEGGGEAPGTAQRVFAEASLAAWQELAPGARGAATPSWRSARAGLEALLARRPEEAWAWNELALLALEAQAPGEALRLALAGLEFAPRDAELLARVVAASEVRGGALERALQCEALAARQPEFAAAHFHAAQARFELALQARASGSAAAAALAACEAGFARARAVERPASPLARACTEHEIATRAARGWDALQAGDLAGARSWFLSTEDLASGGSTWTLPGGIAPALRGLERLAAEYARRGEDVARADSQADLERAARLYEFLHRSEPAEARWPAQGGFRFRDAALAEHDRAQRLWREERRGEAQDAHRRALELMEAGYRLYAAAARLAPEDPALALEAGRILVAYLQREPAEARSWLEGARQLLEARCRALGQRAAGDEAARRQLERAELELGDAWQLLGQLALELEGDPAAALQAFEAALQNGPDTRAELAGPSGLVARAREAASRHGDSRLRASERWDAPLAQRTP